MWNLKNATHTHTQNTHKSTWCIERYSLVIASIVQSKYHIREKNKEKEWEGEENVGQKGNQTGLGQCQASLQTRESFIPNSPASIWNFCFENGGKCQICCRGELLSEEKCLTAHSVEKIRRSSFGLIRAHFRRFVKPWPHATSCQEVEHGVNLRANTRGESNDAFYHPKTGSWAWAAGRLQVKPAHQKSRREMERTLTRSSQAST